MRNRPNSEFQGLQIAEHVGPRSAHTRDRPGIDSQRLLALDVANALYDGAVLMPVAYEVIVAREGHRLGVVRVVHHEYPTLREVEGSVLPVIMHAVCVLLRKPGQVKQVARIVAVDQVDRQAHVNDRMQGGRRNQIAAVQHHLGAERFCLRDGGGERLAVVVAVGDNADLQ